MAHIPTACDGTSSGHPDAHLLPSVLSVLDQHAWRRGHILSGIETARATLRAQPADPAIRFSASIALRAGRMDLRYLRDSQGRMRAMRGAIIGGRA